MAHYYRTVVAVYAAFAVALVVLALGDGSSVSALTYTVTKTADTNDGFCNGDCSLREAIIAANGTSGTPDTILVSAGSYTLTIGGAGEQAAQTGDLDVTSPITITGAGAGSTIIDGGNIDRIFDLASSLAITSFTVTGVTIQNGNPGGANGGGIIIGNGDNVTLINVVISGNSTNLAGGGISNAGTVYMTYVTISGNYANSTGGGIVNANSTGNVFMASGTISGNTAAGSGGGGLYNSHLATLTNVTVSGNLATNGVGGGGGIRNTSGDTVNLTNVTIAGNNGVSGSNVRNDGGVNIKNSIVADGIGGGNCVGALATQGDNLDSGATCGFTQPSDIQNGNAALAGLANNGGPTQTHALNPASQAINNEDNADCPADDQRGYTRNVGFCDYGAYEYGAAGGGPTPTPTTTPTATPTTTPTPTATPPPDADGDTVSDAFDNCPYWPNPGQGLPSWSVPPGDPDCDGFTTAHETSAGTDPFDPCPANSGPNNEAIDAWPPDLNDNQVVDIQDLNAIVPYLFATNARRDLTVDGVVDIQDLNRVLPFLFKSC